MDSVLERIDAPWLLWLIAISAVAYTVLRELSESSKMIQQLLGPLGRHWARRQATRRQQAGMLTELQEAVEEQGREIHALQKLRTTDQWNEDLRRQTAELAYSVSQLRLKVSVLDAYLIYDEEWHRRESLRVAGTTDARLTPHIPFLLFEQYWDGGWRPGQPIPEESPL